MKYWKLTLRDADLELAEAECLEYALQHKERCWVERKVYALPASKLNTYIIFALFSTADRVDEDTVTNNIQLTYKVSVIPIARQRPELGYALSSVERVISLQVISLDAYQLASLESPSMSIGERKAHVFECKEADRNRKPANTIACPGYSSRFFYQLMRVCPWPPHHGACHCYNCAPAGN